MIRNDIPSELRDAIETVENLERQKEITHDRQAYSTGTRIINTLFPEEIKGTERLDKGAGKGAIMNIIPKGRPGVCRETLLVAVGWNEALEKPILEAIVHLTSRCRGTTKYVIFYAGWWSSKIWSEYKSDFQKNAITVG